MSGLFTKNELKLRAEEYQTAWTAGMECKLTISKYKQAGDTQAVEAAQKHIDELEYQNGKLLAYSAMFDDEDKKEFLSHFAGNFILQQRIKDFFKKLDDEYEAEYPHLKTTIGGLKIGDIILIDGIESVVIHLRFTGTMEGEEVRIDFDDIVPPKEPPVIVSDNESNFMSLNDNCVYYFKKDLTEAEIKKIQKEYEELDNG